MDNRNAVEVQRLKKRRDFLQVKKGARSHGRTFLLQALERQVSNSNSVSDDVARFGITVTKKTGNAVVRNRIRRRLREAIRLHAQNVARQGTDYVLIAHQMTLSAPFSELVNEVVTGIARVNKKKTYKKHQSYPISRQSMQSRNEKQPNSGKRHGSSERTQSTGSKIHGK